MVDWGTLDETDKRGVFRAGTSIEVGVAVSNRSGVAGWLIEAALLASGRQSMRLESLVRHPMLFPFRCPAPGTRCPACDWICSARARGRT